MDDFLTPYLGATTILRSTVWGEFSAEVISMTPAVDGDLLIHIGQPFAQLSPLVRIQSECVLGQVFHSDFCDCEEQLNIALTRMVEERHGLLFYLRFGGRGAGLAAQIRATDLEINGRMDTVASYESFGVSAESRNFGDVGTYLVSKGMSRVRLLTNNPQKVSHLNDMGIDVSREPLIVPEPNEDVQRLYHTKRVRLGHLIPDEV